MQHATFTEIENSDRDGFAPQFVGLNIPANLAHEYTTHTTPWQPTSIAVPICDDLAEEIEELLADEEDERIVVLSDGQVSIERQ